MIGRTYIYIYITFDLSNFIIYPDTINPLALKVKFSPCDNLNVFLGILTVKLLICSLKSMFFNLYRYLFVHYN